MDIVCDSFGFVNREFTKDKHFFGNMFLMKFTEWLDAELQKREWTHYKLAKEAGFSEPHISLIFSGKRTAGPEVCNAIAKALKLPPDMVFIKAGLLPPGQSADDVIEEILYNLGGFCMTDKEEIREYIHMKRGIAEKQGTYTLNVRNIPC